MKTEQTPKPNPLSTLTRFLPSFPRHPRHSGEGRNPQSPTPNNVIQRANRAIAADYDRLHESAGVGGEWAKSVYGEYYAISVSVYSAIKLRADAMARAPLQVLRSVQSGGPSGGSVPTRVSVGPDHAAQQLLDRVNPWHTRGDLWRATEINLCLWGSSFWALERDEAGRPEIWPLRSDRVRVLPEKQRHVKGFVYMGVNGPVAYTPEEIVWMRYYNPLEPFAGLSPLAPVRLSVDAGLDALRFNRSFFKNSAQPDIVFTTEETMTDAEVEDFYHRWEERYQGPGKAHRPAIASFIKDIKTLGFNHREMEFLQGLRWSLEDVSRTYGVPPAPALRLPAGHLRQHHHSRKTLLAQHHRPRNALPRGAPQQRTPPPPRLRRPHRRVRPLHHRSHGRRRNRTRRPRNQTPSPRRPNHQRSPPLPQPPRSPLGQYLVGPQRTHPCGAG